MDPSLRNTPALLEHISELRNELIKRFEGILGLAAINQSDRNTTALNQLQLQVETTALIRAAEQVQTLIRQMQEAWLFGQLNTVGDSKVQKATDEKAKEVARLLKQLLEKQNGLSDPVMNGDDTASL